MLAILDTNVLVDGLAWQLPANNIELLNASQPMLAISGITWTEILAKPDLEAQELDDLLLLLSQFQTIEVSRHLLIEAATCRRESRAKLADAIIIATALLCRIPLITSDDRIPPWRGVDIINLKRQDLAAYLK